MLWALLMTMAAMADPYEDVAATAEMDVAAVREVLSDVEKDPSILERMATPWEAKPWHVYRRIFEDDARQQAGLAFWNEHTEALEAAEERTGVPPEIVLAILGVETKFGQVMGDDSVLRSLFTLGFFHERRGPFFRKELGHFLRLGTDEGWDLEATKGSYAGAMGMGQFIPSSYRNFAVDGDGDGKRDLFGNPTDAIASIANYFQVHGWTAGGAVLQPATGEPEALQALTGKGLKLDKTWAQLKAAGAATTPEPAPDANARIFPFEVEDGTDHQVGLHNFYVITRYNHSPLYARAVYELSQRLKAAHSEGETGR